MEYNLHKLLKILPTDYECFGGKVKRWENPNEEYPDCSCGCKYFIKLRECLGNDWGLCANPKSPRKGLLTWEHMSGYKCFEMKEEENG